MTLQDLEYVMEKDAEIERLQSWLNNQVDEIKRKNIEIERLRTEREILLAALERAERSLVHDPNWAYGETHKQVLAAIALARRSMGG